MSRNDLLNSETILARSPARRILVLLKMHGASTAAILGKKLSITGEAVRQQLVRLNEDGLVISYSESRGVGRPSQYWDLTPLGNAEFPDTHAQLTVQMLNSVRELLGQDALAVLIQAREKQTRELYKAALKQSKNLDERVQKLAELRSDEGYMAEVQTNSDGKLTFIENHCPICAAASACQDFCQAELNIFRDLLGDDVKVEREEYIVSGDRRCTYAIQRLETC
jgi:predicted ArsR family transcriptional regulator